jgi:hypothetical protein
MNIPKITDIETALYIYYGNPEIGNKEIISLFGKHSPTTISRLKKALTLSLLRCNLRINEWILLEISLLFLCSFHE